jgi:heme-degrading monooxygenase HmoA
MSEPYIVIVNFKTTPDEQLEALEQIGKYIGDFLSQQPGFIQSKLHRSSDGTQVVNYAQWEKEEDFQAFAGKARSHPDLPGLMKYKPSAGFFQVWKQY